MMVLISSGSGTASQPAISTSGSRLDVRNSTTHDACGINLGLALGTFEGHAAILAFGLWESTD